MLKLPKTPRQQTGSSGCARATLRIGVRDATFFALAVGAASAVASASNATALLPPIVGTCVILVGAPGSAMARLRCVLGGNMIGALSGPSALHAFGGSIWVVVLASTVAFALMLALDCMHSPAGATAALLVASDAAGDIVLWPLVLTLAVVVGAARLRNLGRGPPGRAPTRP